jgi:hypothetical protein
MAGTSNPLNWAALYIDPERVSTRFSSQPPIEIGGLAEW